MRIIATLLKITSYIALILISTLLIINIPLLISLNNTNNILLNPLTYEEKLIKFQIYEKMKDFIIGSFSDILLERNESQQIPISREELKSELSKAIPTNWVKNQTNNLLSNYITYTKGEVEEPNLTISFEEIKPSLGMVIQNITFLSLEKEYANQIPTQVMDTLQCKTLAECIEHCKLPKNKVFCDQIQIQYNLPTSNIGNDVTSQLPNKIDLWEEMKKGNDISFVSQIRDYIKIIRLIPLILLASCLFFITCIIALTRGLKSTSLWLGTSLFFAGILTLGVGYAIPKLSQYLISSYVPASLTQNELFGSISQITNEIIKDIGNSTITHGLVPLSLGLVLLAIFLLAMAFYKPKIKAEIKPLNKDISYIR